MSMTARSVGRPHASALAGSGGADLQVTRVVKSYRDTPVLRGVDVTVPAGEFHALLGPSGSGKTTLLRAIAGFTPVDAGQVRIGGRDVTNVAAERRNTGVVFQNYALFPHMTVAQNVAFGLRMRRQPKPEIRTRVGAALEMVGLSGLQQRRPAELSGGQQQRVALARALVIEPDLLLLDEPLSALDRKIRQSVRSELKRIQSETGVTTIIVTHDQEEALFLADRIFVLDGGSIRQSGTPSEIYRHPTDSFVAGFVGELNRVRGSLRDDGSGAVLVSGDASLPLPEDMRDEAARLEAGSTAQLEVRPEDVMVRAAGELSPPRASGGTVADLEFNGPLVTLHVDISGVRLRSLRLSPGVLEDPALRPGRPVAVWFNSGACRLAAAGTEELP